MKRMFTRIISVLIIALVLIFSVINTMALPEAVSKEITVLFTHDLHSHLLPSKAEDGSEFGGYARLATAIKEQKEKYPDAILVDGGDFSMGSLFQTCFTTEAIELRMMGQMGFDATTFGNHEFDYLPEGLAKMLNVAASCDEVVPAIVDANYLPPSEGQPGFDSEITEAFQNYGVKNYVLIERGGVYFAVFGINGYDSDDCAPNSGMVFENPVAVAQDTVNNAVAYCKEKYKTEPVVVCLSHSGTEDGEGEDFELAKAVEGIDLIVSAHTHTTLTEPIEVGSTYIVSAGEYGKNLGVVNMSFDGESAKLEDYSLIPIDENVKEDPAVSKRVEDFKLSVEKNYLSKYNVTFDEVLLDNPYVFDTVKQVSATQHESALGNVFSDSYKWAVEKATGEDVDVALTAAGVIRETLPVGKVTVSDVFNAASLGVGTEGELVKVYISGKDLKNALEVDASVQPLMKAAQLFFSGVKYSFNTNRMIFNKVDSCALIKADGTEEVIEDDKLYSIVTGMYAGQMLGSVKEKSFGLLSITPLDKDGNPIKADELVNFVVKDENGNPLKEWHAIASYLKEMNGEMDNRYSAPDGRKVVISSFNPIAMLRGANVFTFVAVGVVLLLLATLIFVTVMIVKKHKKRKLNKNHENKQK